jgi:hypothetical protein
MMPSVPTTSDRIAPIVAATYGLLSESPVRTRRDVLHAVVSHSSQMRCALSPFSASLPRMAELAWRLAGIFGPCALAKPIGLVYGLRCQ